MKTVNFTCHGNSAPAYSCNLPGDNSGEYVSMDTYFQIADKINKEISEIMSNAVSYAEKYCDEFDFS